MYTNEQIARNRSEYSELYDKVVLCVFWSLIDRATRKMRGISLNYDHVKKIVNIEMFFDSELTEEEEEEMNEADTQIISDLYKVIEGTILILTIIPTSISIVKKRGNLGWIYLRKEYESC